MSSGQDNGKLFFQVTVFSKGNNQFPLAHYYREISNDLPVDAMGEVLCAAMAAYRSGLRNYRVENYEYLIRIEHQFNALWIEV